MARKTYRLSDETFKVLSGHEAAIAREMECDVSYISKIKSSSEPDRYPAFREIFRASCNAKTPPVEHWLNDLNAIYVRSRMTPGCLNELSARMVEKITDDAKALSALAESLKDGHLDKSECYAILSAISKADETNQRIKTLVLARLGEISESEAKK